MDKEKLRRLKEALELLEPVADKSSDAPNTAIGVGDAEQGIQRRFMSAVDREELRERLSKLSTPTLWAMFREQATTKEGGVPVESWMAAGGTSALAAAEKNPEFRRALDTSSGSALIRQDLEPVLYELYIREFPAWTRFQKEPANGLVHAWRQQTTFGDAKFMTELGTVTDDTSAYVPQTTPISVIATRRGVSLKQQFAVTAGGMSWNPEQLELQAGLRAMSYRMQKTIFEGNSTVSSGTASDENGAYDANAFDGLRKILNTGNAVNVDPFAGTPEDMRQKINDACVNAMQDAGRVSIAYLNPETKALFDYQQDKNIRYMSTYVDVAPGILTNAVNTVFGPLPLFVVPGDAISEYNIAGPQDVADIYLVDEQAISLPYLGSEGPTVLDIPMGISGQLTHLYIVFGMWGLAVKAVQFSNKVRVYQS
jgi:hypothetical protein